MGWKPAELSRREFLLLSTSGGVRNPDGTPAALGYHTGHWEVGLLVKAAADELKALGCIPFAGFCTDPCDGRSQGTTGMMDSLPYRNDAATVLRRLIRSLPTRRGVIGVATCDKGLPAMLMALAAMHDLPCILVPGGVTLPPSVGEDAGKIQTHRRPLRARPDQFAGGGGIGMQGVRVAGRRLPVPRHGGHVASRGRGARPEPAALCPGPVRPADLARHGPPFGAGRRCHGDTEDPHQAHCHRRGGAERHDRPRGLRRQHEPVAAHPGRRLPRRLTTADGRGLDRRQPADAAPGGRPAERPRRPSDGAASFWPAAYRR